MSDIPAARRLLRTLLRPDYDHRLKKETKRVIVSALSLMHRESPFMRVPTFNPPMTRRQVRVARRLRRNGWGLQKIADRIGTNIGRISEAVNGRYEGI